MTIPINRTGRRRTRAIHRHRHPAGQYAVICYSYSDPALPDLSPLIKAAGVDASGPLNTETSAWKSDDANWFAAHPRRSHRMRDRFPDERFPGEPADLPPARICKVAVRQITPVRARARLRIVQVADAAEHELENFAESVAHALFDAIRRGWLAPHEIIAAIKRFEAAAAGATN
jgi:hypothetical protein